MSRFVAVVGRRGRFLVAEPLFERGAGQVAIGGGARVRGGELVAVQTHGARASVIAELGDPGVARDIAAALIWERFGQRGFSGGLEDDAADAAADALAADSGRRDLTALDTFTVAVAPWAYLVEVGSPDNVTTGPSGTGSVWAEVSPNAVKPAVPERMRTESCLPRSSARVG